MKIKFPLFILGYSEDVIFSTENSDNSVYLPIFYDPEKAAAYRKFFIREFDQKLEVYVIDNIRGAIPFFQFLLTIDPELKNITIDPPPPVGGKLGSQLVDYIQFVDFINKQHKNQSNRRHRRRRSGSRHQIHTK